MVASGPMHVAVPMPLSVAVPVTMPVLVHTALLLVLLVLLVLGMVCVQRSASINSPYFISFNNLSNIVRYLYEKSPHNNR